VQSISPLPASLGDCIILCLMGIRLIELVPCGHPGPKWFMPIMELVASCKPSFAYFWRIEGRWGAVDIHLKMVNWVERVGGGAPLIY